MGLFSVQNKILFGKLKHAKHRTENTLAQLDSHYYNHGNVSHTFYSNGNQLQQILVNVVLLTLRCQYTAKDTSCLI